VIAGDRKAATAVLANFRQLSGQRAVKIHPIVARQIDQDVLEKLKASGGGGDEGERVRCLRRKHIEAERAASLVTRGTQWTNALLPISDMEEILQILLGQMPLQTGTP
jgi:hypothetical protein